jgi:hypothetical protein
LSSGLEAIRYEYSFPIYHLTTFICHLGQTCLGS